MGISMVKAKYIGLFLETAMFGLLLGLLTVILFLQRRAASCTPRYVLLVLSLMWSLATAHVAIDLHRGLLVFVNGDVGYFDDFSQPLSYARNTIYFVQALLGDAVLVWRCYILCNRRVVIVALPLLLMLGCLSIAFGSGVIWSKYGNMTEAGTARTRTWSTAYFFLTIGANSYCTSAITYLCARRARQSYHGLRTVFPVIVVVAESGALYTATTLATICMHFAQSNGAYAVLDVLPSLVPVTYCLMVLQVSFPSGSLVYTTTQQVETLEVEILTGVGVRGCPREVLHEHSGKE